MAWKVYSSFADYQPRLPRAMTAAKQMFCQNMQTLAGLSSIFHQAERLWNPS